jgi:hypothetical protein
MDTMDTQQQHSEDAKGNQEAMKAFVDGQVQQIRRHMPMTYEAIKRKADEIGNVAYSLVRLGIAGKPNTFYAIEADRAVGTAFVNVQGADALAEYIRQFGCQFLILWAADAQQGGDHGAH